MATPEFTFQLDPGALADVKPFGSGGPPEAGYYKAKIKAIEGTDDPNRGKLVLVVEADAAIGQAAHDGELWDSIRRPVPNPGKDPEIEKTNGYALREIRGLLESAGHDAAVIGANAVSHLWLIGRYVYIAYVPPVQNGQGGAKYADYTYLTESVWSARKASGVKPERRSGAAAGNAAGGPPPAFQPPPQVGGAPASFQAPPAFQPPPQGAPAQGAPAGFQPPPTTAPQGFQPPPAFQPPPGR